MIGRRTALILGNTLAGAFLGFLALKVFAVETGPYADGLLGELAFAMGLAGLVSVFMDLGMGSAHIKRVSEGRAQGGDAVASFAVVKVALALSVVALVTAGAWTALRLGLLVDTPRAAIVIVALYFACLALRTVFTATFDGRQEFAKSQLVVLSENLLRAPLMMAFSVAFAAVVLGSGPLAGGLRPSSALGQLVAGHGAEFLAACYATAAGVSVLVGLWLFRRGYPFGKPRRDIVREDWGFARHIFLAMAVGTVYVSFDKVVITFFWAAQNTGRYFGAQRFSDLIVMVPAAVYTVLFPTLSERMQRGNPEEVRSSVEGALRHISLVVVPLSAFAIALAGPLLSLTLTGVFLDAVPTLRVLALYALVFAILYPYATLLQAAGRPDLTARAAIVATLLNVGLNLVLVPPRGTLGLPLPGLAETGAAIATLTAACVQLLLLRRSAHGVLGPIPVRPIAKHLAAGVVMGLTLGAVASPLDLTSGHAPFPLMLGLLLLGGIVYVAVLSVLREFTRQDADTYLRIANPAAMLRYVHDEVRARGPLHKRERPPPQS
ncbi:MAG: polysaccharide biosynthesis C-terminal domain-containing protein [Halobacteriales archaeon]|nr:polysaccharide biosynthesis C-terminal domain-containing protein [Halobacteriales archaeon]